VARLGPRFDVCTFHDAVLGSGSLPLLETRLKAWVAQAKAAPSPRSPIAPTTPSHRQKAATHLRRGFYKNEKNE